MANDTKAPGPQVVVSVPCARCDGESPRGDCPACAGHGMILVRVAPEHAALPADRIRELYT